MPFSIGSILRSPCRTSLNSPVSVSLSSRYFPKSEFVSLPNKSGEEALLPLSLSPSEAKRSKSEASIPQTPFRGNRRSLSKSLSMSLFLGSPLMSPLTRCVGLPVLEGTDVELSSSFSSDDILFSSLGRFAGPQSPPMLLSLRPLRFSSTVSCVMCAFKSLFKLPLLEG